MFLSSPQTLPEIRLKGGLLLQSSSTQFPMKSSEQRGRGEEVIGSQRSRLRGRPRDRHEAAKRRLLNEPPLLCPWARRNPRDQKGTQRRWFV